MNEGTNDSNNTLVAPDLIHVTRTPLPDLVLKSVAAPSAAFSGQTITVRWTVQNAGTASTDTALWNDQVWLSTSTSPGGSWGNKLQNVSYLATNEAYIGSANLQIPITDFGTYYIVVRADCDNNVTEDNKQNNITNAVIQVQLTPPPDLQVTSVQAPENSFSGQSIPVTWTVANLGPGPVLAASSTWVDTVLLSRTNVLDSSATTLYSQRHYGVLLTNQSYSVQNQAVTLPRNILGDYYVFVVTDAGNEVFEYGYENNNANYDHTPVHVTLTPPPDLIVESVTVPKNGTAGQTLTVSWQVLNQGAGDTVATLWYDSVYASQSPAFDSSATLIGNFYHSGLLAPGGRYTASTTYTPSVCSSGPFYFYVVTDSYNHVQEFDPSYNAEGNNLTRAGVPTSIAPVGAPDLQISWVTGPQIGTAGSNIVVSWVGTNAGSASAPAGWIDRIILLRTPDYSSGSPRSILDVRQTTALAVGASYTNTVSALVPSDASGFYYVFVMADAANVVAECAGEGNNLGGSLGITYINPAPPPPRPPPPPALQVASVGAPATAISGQNVAISWVVNNTGAGPAGGTWQDSVYLLPSPTTTAGAIFMGTFAHNGPVPAGSNYQASASITLPYRFSGAYYVMVWADSGNNLGEASNQNNNSTISPTPLLVIQAPLPDLQVTSVTAPTSALEGQNITVNWAVTNAGTGPTVAASWSDYVYLSRDQVLDPTDQFLGYATFNGVLSSGQSYSQSLSVQLPRGISGPYYIFVLSDARNAVLELSEDNNYSYASQPVQVDFQPLSDLTVTSVTAPGFGSPGQPATFAWTVANQGGNAASGTWVDSVYVSTNQTWDISAPLVGKVPHNGPLQPGQSYTASLTATLPAVTPGPYYAIVRADILNNVRESDENNNAGVSAQTMAADVVELTLGQPYQSQLNNGTEHYYKVSVPSNQVMSVILDAAQTNGFDELFTRFGTMPDRGAYDFLYSVPWEPDQTIVVPDTQGGYYYHLARGEYVPQPPTPYTIKAELVPFSITSVSPTHIGDNGQVTITLHGALFQDGASVQLVSGTNLLVANKITVLDSATAKARFYFTNALNALYDAVLSNPGGQVTTAAQAIRIEPAVPLAVSTAMIGNQTPRGGQATDFRCAARNTSNVDAPYVVVQTIVDGASPWSLRRPANTFPRGCTGCNPNPLASLTDTPTGSASGFIARDLEPGQELLFQIDVARVSGPTTIAFAGMSLSTDEFTLRLADFLESVRQAILANTSVPLQPPLSDTLADAAVWRATMLQQFVEFGVIDSAAFDPLRASSVRTRPSSAEIGPKQADECLETCRSREHTLCNLLTGGETAACILACPGCAFFCIIQAVPAHIMCETTVDWACAVICHHNCQIAEAEALIDGGASGASVCPQYPRDPNELRGPIGYGTTAFVSGGSTLSYTIYFENVTNATATARQVQVVNQLDPTLDPRTVRIQKITFGGYSLVVPENRSFYQGRVQLDTNFNNILADISAGVDVQNGRVVWTLTAIDPNTGEQPQSALLGLLPPNDTNHVGEGYVTYTVQPKAGTPTGTVITNKATIVFDNNEPIDTDPWWNTVDSGAPSSAVAALQPVSTNTTFTVSWFGIDDKDGSGVSSYDVFVSDNGEPYQSWQTGTTLTTDSYTGQRGHTYAFYSVATDNVGNREADHATPDAFTTITNYGPIITGVSNQIVIVGNQLMITNSATDPNGPITFNLGANAPAGATITTNGLFTWSPTCTQGSTTNLITIWATDSAIPPLSNSITFTVIAGECVQVAVGSTVVQIGQIGCVPVNLVSTVGLTNLSFTLLYLPDRLTNFVVSATNVAVGTSVAQTTGSSQAFFSLNTLPGQVLQGPAHVETLCFAVPPGPSAFVPLAITNVTGLRADGASVGNILGQPGRIVVVGTQPLLEAWLSTNSRRMLTLYGNPGASYLMNLNTNLASTNWSLAWRVPLTNLSETFEAGGALPQAFYRAKEFAADPPILEFLSHSPTNATLLLYGRAATNYTLEASTNLSLLNAWLPATNFTLTNSFRFIGVPGPTNGRMFYRALRWQ